jgi:hypothetical protein
VRLKEPYPAIDLNMQGLITQTPLRHIKLDTGYEATMD